jgi:hypothetical protein
MTVFAYVNTFYVGSPLCEGPYPMRSALPLILSDLVMYDKLRVTNIGRRTSSGALVMNVFTRRRQRHSHNATGCIGRAHVSAAGQDQARSGEPCSRPSQEPRSRHRPCKLNVSAVRAEELRASGNVIELASMNFSFPALGSRWASVQLRRRCVTRVNLSPPERCAEPNS